MRNNFVAGLLGIAFGFVATVFALRPEPTLRGYRRSGNLFMLVVR